MVGPADLSGEDEPRESGAIDPRNLVQDREGGQDPKTVADLFLPTRRSGYLMRERACMHANVRLLIFRDARSSHRWEVDAQRATIQASARRSRPTGQESQAPRCTPTLQRKKKGEKTSSLFVRIGKSEEQFMTQRIPCPAWLSAPATRPKPPSKLRHEARYETVRSRSRRSSAPSNDRADTAQYKNRVSVSPNASPAKMPEGCCKPRMSVGSQSLRNKEKRRRKVGVRSTTRGTSMRARASCVARIWIALSVERMCASCPGCAPKAPLDLGV